MFGWKVMSETEFTLRMTFFSERLADARAENAKLTRLVEYWQERADAERIRADRQLDGLLQQNGLAPVSETTHREIRERKEANADEIAKQDKYLTEMFAETTNDAVGEEVEQPAS